MHKTRHAIAAIRPFQAGALVIMLTIIGSPLDAARAASLTFSATLTAVDEDTGSGLFAGASAGQSFSGQASYGDSAGDASAVHIEAGEADYEFPPIYSGSVTSGGVIQSATAITVNIQNDHVLDADEAGLASELAGAAIDPGTMVDVWSLTGFTPGASEQDLTPGDGDDSESLIGGGRLELVLLSLDTALFTSTDFVALPPAPGGAVFGALFLDEGDAAGEVLFSAYGRLDTAVAVVPVPAPLALLPAALGLLAVRRRSAPAVALPDGSHDRGRARA